MTATSQPVLAYRAKDALEARALAAHLEAAGVESHVVGEFLQGAYAGLSIGGMDSPEVWVSSADLPRARALIGQWREALVAQSDSERLPSSAGASKPFKIQFSTAALLWLMTCVAIFAAGVAFELVTYVNWPSWIFALIVCSLVLLVALNGARRAVSKTTPSTDDIPKQD